MLENKTEQPNFLKTWNNFIEKKKIKKENKIEVKKVEIKKEKKVEVKKVEEVKIEKVIKNNTSIINHPDFIKVWGEYREFFPSFMKYCTAVEEVEIEDIERLRGGKADLSKKRKKSLKDKK